MKFDLEILLDTELVSFRLGHLFIAGFYFFGEYTLLVLHDVNSGLGIFDFVLPVDF